MGVLAPRLRVVTALELLGGYQFVFQHSNGSSKPSVTPGSMKSGHLQPLQTNDAYTYTQAHTGTHTYTHFQKPPDLHISYKLV